MIRTADVVVIGGGANGTSTAFHLTRLGVRNVVLVERRQLAAGATGKSGALVRMHYTNEAESRLAFESLKVFRNFGEIVGGDCGFESVGFVQLVGREYTAALHRNVARQQKLGINTRAIAPAEVGDLLPGADVSDVGAAAWEADSGFADPSATTFAFAEAARLGGARIETGVEALRVATDGARVAGVETSDGRIAAPTGMIMMSADGRPIIDRLGPDGLWGMLGDSGTSFKTSPAIGRCLAEWIVTGASTTADLHPFRASRFAEGRPWHDPDHYGGQSLTV